MPSPRVRPTTNILRRFRRNRRGSAAVEFALVAPLFFALLFAIIETGDGVFRQPGARDRDAGFRAHDHDRSGAERGLHPGAVQELSFAASSPSCSTA